MYPAHPPTYPPLVHTAKKFKTKGLRHDTSIPPPRGDAPADIMPQLPLLYNSKGLPAEPSPPIGMSKEEFEAYHTRFIENLKGWSHPPLVNLNS